MSPSPEPHSQPAARRSRPSRATRCAWWILLIVAVAQVAAVGWSFGSRLTILPRYPVPLPEDGVTAEVPGVPRGGPPAVAEVPDPGSGGEAIGMLPEVDALGGEVPTIPSYDPTAILEPNAAELVRQALASRQAGDTQGALAQLRDALGILPAHPRILYEIANTYEVMGLDQKAAPLWKEIHAMGDLAGEILAIADFRLKGIEESAEPELPKLLEIGEVVTTPDVDAVSGQRVVVQVPLRCDSGTAIDSTLVEVHVHFFDLVNGIRVEQTTADNPASRWLTGPAVDWKDPTGETLEIVYFHPSLSPLEQAEFGRREYYGFIIKLYYDNVLIDQAADPPTLFEQVLESGSRGGGDPLDSGLFPADE